jgi:hypothetical protein
MDSNVLTDERWKVDLATDKVYWRLADFAWRAVSRQDTGSRGSVSGVNLM